MKSIKWQMFLSGIITFVLVVLDQAAKQAAQYYLQGKDDFVIWKGVFELHYLENRGSAFGLLQGKRIFFIVMAALVLLVVPYIHARIPFTRRFLYLHIVAILFLAGAVGNAIDRILHGYVIDFFYFSLIDFPVFNVADIYVSAATAALIVLVWFYYTDEDFEQIRLWGAGRQ